MKTIYITIQGGQQVPVQVPDDFDPSKSSGAYDQYLNGIYYGQPTANDPNYITGSNIPDYLKSQFKWVPANTQAETTIPAHWEFNYSGDSGTGIKDASGNTVYQVGGLMNDPGKYFKADSGLHFDKDLGWVVTNHDAVDWHAAEHNSWHSGDWLTALATIGGGFVGANALAGTLGQSLGAAANSFSAAAPGDAAATQATSAAAAGTTPGAAGGVTAETTAGTTAASTTPGMIAPGMEGQALAESNLLNAGITPGTTAWEDALAHAGLDTSAGAATQPDTLDALQQSQGYTDTQPLDDQLNIDAQGTPAPVEHGVGDTNASLMDSIRNLPGAPYASKLLAALPALTKAISPILTPVPRGGAGASGDGSAAQRAAQSGPIRPGDPTQREDPYLQAAKQATQVGSLMSYIRNGGIL